MAVPAEISVCPDPSERLMTVCFFGVKEGGAGNGAGGCSGKDFAVSAGGALAGGAAGAGAIGATAQDARALGGEALGLKEISAVFGGP